MNTFNNYVQQIQLFKELKPKSLDFLADRGLEKQIAKGQTLFLEGEPCSGIYLVISGQIKVFKQGNTGRQQTINFFKAGQSFNEIGLIKGVKNAVNAVALEPSHIFIVPCAAIGEILQNEPQFVQKVILNLTSRIHYLSELVRDLSIKSVRSRLAEYLLLESQDNDGIILRHDWYTQEELAARLGTVTDVIQRTLKQFDQMGAITMSRSQIEITNQAMLNDLI